MSEEQGVLPGQVEAASGVREPQSILVWPIPFSGMVSRSPGPAIALLTATMAASSAWLHNWNAAAAWAATALVALVATRWEQYTLNLEKHVAALFSVAVAQDTSEASDKGPGMKKETP